jgi:hypothetical protein
MKRKTFTKIAIDAVMAVLFVILIFAYDTGLAFHEIAGLTIFVFFASHVILNWSWVKNITLNLFNNSLKRRTMILYILNAALLISVSTIIITGILISRVVFNFAASGNTKMLSAVHEWTAYACLGLFAVHIALNRRFISVTARKIFSNFEGIRFRKPLHALGAAAMVVAIVYSLIATSPGQAPQQAAAQNNPPRQITAVKKDDAADHDYKISDSAADDTKDTVSLADYLANMFCTGCDKHCPLLSPKCDKGEAQLQAAKIKYQEIYG